MPRIKSNPDNPCPPEILSKIVQVPIPYVDFKGTTHSGYIEVSKDLANDVADFFDLALKLKFPINNVTPASNPHYNFDDDKLMSSNASSGFNYRFISGTNKPSLHGLGCAIDVNPLLNPYIGYDKNGNQTAYRPAKAIYDQSTPGTFSPEHPLVVFMKSRDWEWGGDWTKKSGRVDLHHFQRAAD